MTEDELLERITWDPAIFGGKPIIRGMRIAVEHVLGMLAAGDTPERLLQEYPFLEAATFRRAWPTRTDRSPANRFKSALPGPRHYEVSARRLRVVAIA